MRAQVDDIFDLPLVSFDNIYFLIGLTEVKRRQWPLNGMGSSTSPCTRFWWNPIYSPRQSSNACSPFRARASPPKRTPCIWKDKVKKPNHTAAAKVSCWQTMSYNVFLLSLPFSSSLSSSGFLGSASFFFEETHSYCLQFHTAIVAFSLDAHLKGRRKGSTFYLKNHPLLRDNTFRAAILHLMTSI